jgi:HTH-type transcriptional regulator/antitoxin HipB
MHEFTVRTAAQLPDLLQALRKQAGLTQREVAQRLGVTQQTMSAMERNAETVSAERLMRVLSILGAELVLRAIPAADAADPASATITPSAW